MYVNIYIALFIPKIENNPNFNQLVYLYNRMPINKKVKILTYIMWMKVKKLCKVLF